MDQLTKDLLQMILDAHEACKSENMNCPWCSGRIRYDYEDHDEFCKWMKLKETFPRWGEGK